MTCRNRKIDLQEATRLYEAGYTCSEIAKHFGVSRQAVYSLLSKYGVYQPGGNARQIDFNALNDSLERGRKDLLARLRKRERISQQVYRCVTKAIAEGSLVPQPCEVCSSMPILANGNRGVQAHHDDYTKPLEVRWLCSKHHAEWHRLNKPRYE